MHTDYFIEYSEVIREKWEGLGRERKRVKR